MSKEIEINRIDECLWEVPRSGPMNVPVRVYADEELIGPIKTDNSLEQAVNVAGLPGIVRASYVMPDAHWGYGFPIGGVAAFDEEAGGVISPGGIGFDINCGVRLVRTELGLEDVEPKLKHLVDTLYSEVPCGVGSEGGIHELSPDELREVMVDGAAYAVRREWGVEDDLVRTEAGGAMEGAEPDYVSKKAVKRGRPQVGTLGSGNHFMEVDLIEEVFDERIAEVFGVQTGKIAVQIHCGSRGFGHQICSDFLKVMQRASEKYNISLADRQLACAPLGSEEAKRYFGAMVCGANFAWCNRQVIQSLALGAFRKVFGGDRGGLGWRQVYDVCHNIAKFETHDVDGEEKKLCIHRKGATRAFPPGHAEVPEPYREVGQPVLIPGDMGSASYLLAGTEGAMERTWGSTCHGAGRTMSRREATRRAGGRKLKEELARRGVIVRARGRDTIAEEMPYAYKDVKNVVNVMHRAGITRRVARLRPLAVVKG